MSNKRVRNGNQQSYEDLYDANSSEETAVFFNSIQPNNLDNFEEYQFGFSIKDSVVHIQSDIVHGSLFDLMVKVRTILSNRDEEHANDPISIVLNTNGGDAYEAFGIIDYIQSLPVKVNIIARGRCFSAGFLILVAATGQRMASKNTFLMIHELYTDMGGNASDIISNSAQIHRMSDLAFSILANHTKLSDEEWKKRAGKDYYITAEEAVELGVIDQVY